MKITAAIDSFKGSMTSMEAGQAAAEGIHRVDPEIQVVVRPLADGGEGTVEAITEGLQGTCVHVQVSGPLGEPVDCVYGIVGQPGMAVMEMSAAAGITLVPAAARNPLEATTYGVGKMIRDAVQRGCRRFIIGIGGSATNDGGVGMLEALGWRFLDREGAEIPRGAQGLRTLDRIDESGVLPELAECRFRIACDVTNPLCGPDGCSAVFGPQKGATPDMVQEMDQWLAHYAAVVQRMYPDADPAAPGSGAAGGLGFCLRTFLHGSLESGVKIVLEETHLAEDVKDADLVITGEGRLDAQTVMGKAPAGVAALAKQYGKPVIALAGSVSPDAGVCHAKGIDAFFPIVRGVTTLEEAMKPDNAKENMARAAEEAIRLFLAASYSRGL